MKVFVSAFVLLVAVAGLAFGQDAPGQVADYPVCDYSGLRWDTSSTRIEITVFHGEDKSAYKFASLYSMMMFISEAEILDEDIGELGEFKMLDYDSYGKDKPVWITSGGEGPPEMFVVHTETAIPGSQPPFMAAFMSEESAYIWFERWGGEVYGAEESMDVLFRIIGPELEKNFPMDESGADAPPSPDEG